MITGPSRLQLPARGMEALVHEALGDGHRFVARFVAQWDNRENRFDASGERLLGIWDDEVLIAFVGLNIDPYQERSDVGRLRHLYVARAWRRRGLAQQLLTAVLSPPLAFSKIRLRAGGPEAAAFYDRAGWMRSHEADATHIWLPDRAD